MNYGEIHCLFTCYFLVYVEHVKLLLFNMTKPEMMEVYDRYSAKTPESLTAQFGDRIDKKSAVKAHKEKCEQRGASQLFPSG